MKNIIHKAATAAIIGSMMLSAAPAFARSDSSKSNERALENMDRIITVDSHSKADIRIGTKFNAPRVVKVEHGRDDDKNHDRDDDKKTDTGALIARAQAKMNKQLSMSARHAGVYGKKICTWMGNGSGTALTACMKTQRDAFLATFTTQLNLAFGL